MAVNLNKTKRRIASINSTKKITKAMELIASVKLKKFKNATAPVFEFAKNIESVLSSLITNLPTDHHLLTYKEAEKDLYIVVNSNLGLCAGFNNDIFKHVINTITRENSKILTIGQRGYHLRAEGYDIDDSFIQISLKMIYDDFVRLSDYLLNAFLSSKYKAIYLVYTKYINSLRFEPKTIRLFPLELTKANKTSYGPICDTNESDLLKKIVPLYITSKLYDKILEAQLSEQASRRNAMESANDNADELIEQLSLEYNKARQAAITSEIAEVISASFK